MTMRKFLIAIAVGTSCVLAGANLASASESGAATAHATAHRSHRGGVSLQAMMSKMMRSGVLSQLGGVLPGGLEGLAGGDLTSLGSLPANLGDLPF
jgi:hypothetical protein